MKLPAIGRNSAILEHLSSATVNRFVFLCILVIAALPGYAGIRDSLFLQPGINGARLIHLVAPGETLGSLSRRYFISPDLLADANGFTVNDQLPSNVTISIPLGEYNVPEDEPVRGDLVKPVFYLVQRGDNIYYISDLARVTVEQILRWNGPINGSPLPGRVIQVGWVRYDPASFETGPATIVRPMKELDDDTAEYLSLPVVPAPAVAKSDVPPSLEQEWNEQTVEGLNAVTEKGTAGFFPISEKAPKAAIYAFHNAAARGTVMRVRNMNNDRVIYVKVLGPLPVTKMFAGCVLGLSSGAKAALGVRETKAFCEMSYAGY